MTKLVVKMKNIHLECFIKELLGFPASWHYQTLEKEFILKFGKWKEADKQKLYKELIAWLERRIIT